MNYEASVIFAKELNTESFEASDGWLRRWKERNNISFKTVSGSRNLSHQRWLMRSWKRHFQLFCRTKLERRLEGR